MHSWLAPLHWTSTSAECIIVKPHTQTDTPCKQKLTTMNTNISTTSIVHLHTLFVHGLSFHTHSFSLKKGAWKGRSNIKSLKSKNWLRWTLASASASNCSKQNNLFNQDGSSAPQSPWCLKPQNILFTSPSGIPHNVTNLGRSLPNIQLTEKSQQIKPTNPIISVHTKCTLNVLGSVMHAAVDNMQRRESLCSSAKLPIFVFTGCLPRSLFPAILRFKS